MIMRHYFTEDGTYGSVGMDNFVILNTADFTDKDWETIENDSDCSRITTAKKIHSHIWNDNDQPRTNWDNLDNLMDRLGNYITAQDDIELHALYVDLSEALGY